MVVGTATATATATAMPLKLLVMGVSGCGKSTLAEAVAARLGASMIEGDAFHPAANVERMRRGIALTDADREPWLDALGARLASENGDAVLSCSALKRAYRARLRDAVPGLRIVFIEVTPDDANARVSARASHFLSPALVTDQFATLEPPTGEAGVLRVDGRWSTVAQCDAVLAWLAREIANKKSPDTAPETLPKTSPLVP